MPQSRSFTVQVPASSANFGSGFDTIATALSLYLEVRVECGGKSGIEWPEGWDLPLEDNILDRSLRAAFQVLGQEPPGLRLAINNPIPVQRGLGSSGTAIIAGIKIAEHLCAISLDREQMFEIALPLEGHPDNLAASLLGGWVLSWISGGKMWSERLPSTFPCRFILAIPKVLIPTREARSILPNRYPRAQAIFNLQRCALLVHSLHTGRRELLREATKDQLHQSYRSRLVPGIQPILERDGLDKDLSRVLLSVTISGSGSTVVALAEDHWEEISKWMLQTLAQAGTSATSLILDQDQRGGRVLSEP